MKLFPEPSPGIVAGVLLPASLFLFNWIRNIRLEKKIREGFSRCGTGRQNETFHLTVENHLPIEVRIRAVVLVGRGEGPWHVHLKYLRPLPQSALLNTIGLDNHPVRIIAGAHFSDEVGPKVAASLPGFTGGNMGSPM